MDLYSERDGETGVSVNTSFFSSHDSPFLRGII